MIELFKVYFTNYEVNEVYKVVYIVLWFIIHPENSCNNHIN